jgi:hypothetical protein
LSELSSRQIEKFTARLHKEQPDLMEFVLGMTADSSPDAHELAFFVFTVIWETFRRATPKRIEPVTADAIVAQYERNMAGLDRLEGAHEEFLKRAAAVQMSHCTAVVGYLVEAIMEAPLDPEAPLELTDEDIGMLYLVLITVIDLLDEARKRCVALPAGKRVKRPKARA